jgi:uncharacterized protein (TIGR03437 family)
MQGKMLNQLTRLVLTSAMAWAVTQTGLQAYVSGPDPRLSGAPGDENCTACHSGTVNSGPGSVKIKLAGGNTYTPGVKQRIQVEVSDPDQRRWGFEFTARLASSPDKGQAGSLAPVDRNTQVICDNGDPAPCASASVVQFITHTQAGTRLGTTGGVTFDIDWTPPASDVGAVRLFAAGNAANGNNQNTGDRVYTTNVELTPAAAVVSKPAINATDGVVNAAGPKGAIAASTWIVINGTGLASTTRTWTAEEIAEGARPTKLDNVSVTVNGKAAVVQYISPTQINALTPADDSLGPVEVKVTTNDVTSDAATATLQPFAPALFTFDGKYLATSADDNVTLTTSGKFLAADKKGTVKPGDSVTLFGTGFGPVDAANAPNLVNAPTVTIGGVAATVTAAVVIDKSPQIYQLTVTVPDVADGDQAVVVQVGGISSPTGPDYGYLTVAK